MKPIVATCTTIFGTCLSGVHLCLHVQEDAEGESLSDVEVDDAKADDIEAWKGNKMICQYTKAKRTKVKWSMSLQDGIVNIKGQDLVFKTAEAEFQFLG